MRKLALATLSTLATVAAVAGVAGTASAAGRTGTITQPTTSYTGPHNMNLPVHALGTGTSVEVLCVTEGQWLNDTNLWFLIRQHGNDGYVNRAALDYPPMVPEC